MSERGPTSLDLRAALTCLQPLAALRLAERLELEAQRLDQPFVEVEHGRQVTCNELELQLLDRCAPAGGGNAAPIDAQLEPRPVGEYEFRRAPREARAEGRREARRERPQVDAGGRADLGE